MHSNKQASDRDNSVMLTRKCDPYSVSLTHLKQLLNPIVYL